jgi:hypothetical protein
VNTTRSETLFVKKPYVFGAQRQIVAAMERGREDWKREAYKDQMVSHAGNDGVGYSSIMSAPEFVRIRVGGEIFETTKDTLTNDPGSIFSAMLRSVSFLQNLPGAEWSQPLSHFIHLVVHHELDLTSLSLLRLFSLPSPS